MIVTRFAPSPTGRLHLGHAYSAALGHAGARRSGGHSCCGSRISTRPAAAPNSSPGSRRICAGSGSSGTASRWCSRSGRTIYAAALEQLQGARAWSIPASAPAPTSPPSLTAPHGDAGSSYPGTCRGLADDPERRAATPHSWRLDCAKALAVAGLPSWVEDDGESFRADARDIGDAILARKDAPASYHLACVVDDAASGVTLVVRGADLRPSTPIQRLLQELLGLPAAGLSAPSFGHPRRRAAAGQARPGADAGGDARQRASTGRALAARAARGPAAPWFRLQRSVEAAPCRP